MHVVYEYLANNTSEKTHTPLQDRGLVKLNTKTSTKDTSSKDTSSKDTSTKDTSSKDTYTLARKRPCRAKHKD